jgi:hypothetical protein
LAPAPYPLGLILAAAQYLGPANPLVISRLPISFAEDSIYGAGTELPQRQMIKLLGKHGRL